MSRLPSAETELRNVKRDLKEAREQLGESRAEANSLRRNLVAVRDELNEWKSRFDKLLERTPKLP